MKKILWIASISLCCLLGLFFQVALVGYGFLSMVCFGLAILIGSFWLMHRFESKKWVRVLRTVLITLLAVGFCAAAITGTRVALGGRPDPDEDCPYVLVLGAGVNGTEPSLALKSRLNAAAAYLEEHPETFCIVSGGQGPGEDITEAQCMYTYLVGLGIDPARILQEDRSTSTRENFLFSLALLEKIFGTAPEELNVVTNEFHLYRAKGVAAELGLTAHSIPAKTPLPVLFVNCFLREIPVSWYYALVRLLG